MVLVAVDVVVVVVVGGGGVEKKQKVTFHIVYSWTLTLEFS